MPVVPPYGGDVTMETPNTDPICMNRHRNYKVSLSIGRGTDMMIPLVSVLDTGAGPNIINANVLPAVWRTSIKSTSVPPLVDAQSRPLRCLGVLPLIVRIGQFKARVHFVVVTNMAVDCILGTSFCDRHVHGIFPRTRRVAFHDGSSVPIIGQTAGLPKFGVPQAPPPAQNPKLNTSNRVRLARKILLPPMTQTEVDVRVDQGGLRFIQAHPKLIDKHMSLAANGVMDVTPNRPFRILMSNFGAEAMRLPKNTVVALSLPAPAAILTVNPYTMNPDHPPDKHKSVHRGERPDTNPVGQNWQEDVHIGLEDDHSRAAVINLLSQYQDMWSGKLGTISAAKHRIEVLPDARPIYQQPYRAGPQAREAEKREIEKMLSAQVIEPSSSEWASPVVFVPKKDGTLRFCVDYRRLNAVTKRDAYPLPRMDECIDSLGEATIFSTLDCNSGYWQIEIDDRDKDKTTFTSHSGLFRFLRMPFGLRNAPATFQRAVDIILSKVKWQFALVYLDDVIIYSKTVSDHFNHVRVVLSMLQKAGVSLKLAKCKFFDASVDYLGHVVRPGQLEVASRTVDAVRQFKTPADQGELRSFLGMCNVYRRFVPNFARVAAPLNQKLKKGEPFQFDSLNDEEYKAFADLKVRLISPPVLALPRHGLRYTLDTDACAHQVGCALLQDQPNGDKLPIGYWSRTLTTAERNYSTTEKECLAIVWSVLTLRPYLYGQQFTIRTDHEPLRWILNIVDVSGRLARWRLRLSEYDFIVEYRPGRKNNLADGMSRMPTAAGDQRKLEDDIPCLAILPNPMTETDPTPVGGLWDTEGECPFVENVKVLTLAEEGGEESDIVPITVEEFLQAQATDSFCQEKAKAVGDSDSQFDYDRYGLLVRKAPLDGALQRVVPKALRARLLYLTHYPRLAGHPGGTRMYLTLRRDFYWPQMGNDVHAVARDCRSCAQMRGTRYKHQKYLKLFPAAGPLEFVAMDLLGPLPKTKSGHVYVLVITDRFSKLTRAIPLGSTTASSVAKAFLEHWVYVYGVPNYLLTDNGPQFAAKFFDTVCGMLGVKHFFTTAYHPQTNGQAERFNKTILDRIRHYVVEHQADWDKFIQPLAYAYNMQVHRVTNTTPFDLVLSRHPPDIIIRGQTTAIPSTVPDTEATPVQVKRNILRKLRQALQAARSRSTQAQKRYKEDFDRKVRFRISLQPGDYVFVDRPPRTATDSGTEDTTTRKLLPRATGPFEVKSASEDTVTVEQDGLLNTISIDRVTKVPSTTPAHTRSSEATEDSRRPLPDETDGGEQEPPPEEYAVDRIVGHKYTSEGMLYQVRWFGYSAEEDTWEPEVHIPYNFIKRYWDRMGN